MNLEGSPYHNQQYSSQFQYQSNQYQSQNNQNDYFEESLAKQDAEFNSNSQQYQLTQEQKNMPPLEKIQSNKWQLRKIGYQEIQSIFSGYPQTNLSHNDDYNTSSYADLSLENYAPWLKNIIIEKNQIALNEGLKAIEIYISNFKGQMSSQILKYFIGDLMEKAPLLKPLQQQIATSIISNSLLKGDVLFITGEITKRFDSTQPKIVLFGLQIIKQTLEYQLQIQEQIFIDETMRSLFKSNLAVLKNTNKDIRATAIENLKLIFMQCKETYEEISKAFLNEQRSIHQKEIQDLFKKTKKVASKSIQIKLIQEEMQKNLESEKINKQVISKGQKVDLQGILPDKFFEIPYFPQPNQKKNKLEEMWQNIEKLINKQVQVYTHKDNKDYSNIYNVLISCLEESNFLIFSEALKCIQSLMKVMKNGIPFPILKHFLTLTLDKFRGPKARQYNQIVWQVLDDCYFNQCCTNDQLIDFLLVQCDNEKNLHMRIGCINWLGGRFIPRSVDQVKDSIDLLNMDTQICTQRGEKLQKLIDIVDKKIEQISKKALNLQLKESCQYLLARKPNEYFNEYNKENTNTQNYQYINIPSNQQNIPQNIKQSSNIPQANPNSNGGGNNGSQQNNQNQQKQQQQPQKQAENVNLLDMDFKDVQIQPKKDNYMSKNQNNYSDLIEEFDDFSETNKPTTQQSYTNLKTEDNNSRVLLNKDQETIAQSIQNDLHNLNQLLLKQCKIQQMEIFCQDFFDWLNNISSDDMQAVQDLCISYLFAFSCSISSNKNDIKSSHYDKASELICNSFITINKACVFVNQENVQRQIEAICGLLQYGNTSRVNALLDSAFIVCSLEKLLQSTHNIVKKYKLNKSLYLFITWISQKLDKTTKDVDIKMLNSLLNTVIYYDDDNDGKYRILIDSLNFKIDFQSQRSFGNQGQSNSKTNKSKNNNNDNKNRREQQVELQNNQGRQNYSQKQNIEKDDENEYYKSEQNEEDDRQNQTQQNSVLYSNQSKQYNFNQNNTQQFTIKQIEADLNKDFETGIENLVSYLQDLTELPNLSTQQDTTRNPLNKKDASPSQQQRGNNSSVSPGRPWRRGIGRESTNQTPSRATDVQLREIRQIAEKICSMTNSEDQLMCQQSFYALLQIKNTLIQLSQNPNQQMEYLFYNVFLQICRQSFKHTDQKQLLREFISQLELNIQRQVIFTAYKNAFSVIVKNYHSFSYNFLINVFMHFVYQMSDEQNINVIIQIDLKDVQYFVESIIFCLSEQGLHQMGSEIMQKLFMQYDNAVLRRIFETELVNSMRYYAIYEEWYKDIIHFDSSAIQATEENHIMDMSNHNIIPLDLYGEIKQSNRDPSQDKSLASILLRNEEITNHLPNKQNNNNNNNNLNQQNKNPIQNVRGSVENLPTGGQRNIPKRNILEDDLMNEQKHYDQVQQQQQQQYYQQQQQQQQNQQNKQQQMNQNNPARNKSNSNNSGATPNNQANRTSQNSDQQQYTSNQSIGQNSNLLSEESILNFYPQQNQNQRAQNHPNLLQSNNGSGNNNVFYRPPQPQGSNNNLYSSNNLNQMPLLQSNNILQDGSLYQNNQILLDYSNSILDSANYQSINSQANINNNNKIIEQLPNKNQNNNINHKSSPNILPNNKNLNNELAGSNIQQQKNHQQNSVLHQLNEQRNKNQINQGKNQINQGNNNSYKNEQINQSYNTNQPNNNMSYPNNNNNYFSQEHEANVFKQLNEIQQQNSQVLGYGNNQGQRHHFNHHHHQVHTQQDIRNSPSNKQRNASVDGNNQSSVYDYLRENNQYDNNQSSIYDGQDKQSQPNSNVKMYRTNRNQNPHSAIHTSQFNVMNQNHATTHRNRNNISQTNYDSLEEQTAVPSANRNLYATNLEYSENQKNMPPSNNVLDYEELATNEPGSAERYSGITSRNMPNNKSGQKQRFTQRSDLNSVSPIIKQIDQLSSNRHYYASQEGKLNFSDMSYLLPTGIKQAQNFPHAYNSNGSQDDAWHLKYKEEMEQHQKTKENLLKIQEEINLKEKQEQELLQRLEEEKKVKDQLSQQISQIQSQPQQQIQSIQRNPTFESYNQQMEQSKVNGIQLQEQYISYNSKQAITAPAKSPFELVPSRSREKIECVKQLQEILLTSEQLYNDMGEQIIMHYEGLDEVIDKIDFVIDLKLAIVDKVLLENMSENNYRIILMITLRLCTSQTTQKEIYVEKDQKTYRQNDLTKELQTLLDSLLSAKSISIVMVSGLKILNTSVPSDLSAVYTKNLFAKYVIYQNKDEKMLFRLILKCLEKLLACYEDIKELRVFEVLTEIYKFFKCHPPENLNESLPCLKDLEFIFRQLKTLTDQMVSANHEMACEFVEFIISKHRKNVYLDYLQSLVNKINESIKESQVYRNQSQKN